MPETQHRIFTATLLLGVPGAGKTSLLATFARYLWDTHKRVLLLYSWDGGAIPTDLQKLMQQGLIRFWRARTRSAAGLGIETLYFASKGYWPKAIDPLTGETSPAVDLAPAVTTLYQVSCPKGHELARLPSRSQVTPSYCEGCKTLIALPDLAVIESVHITKGFEQVGGVAFDGLTSMTDVVMDHMDQQRGQGHIGGEKSAFGGVVTSGATKFGGNNRADVGFAQRIGKSCVHNSLSIPNLKEGPVFTALSMEATDEGGLPIVGAKLPGRAATDEASSWFGNVFEMGRTNDDQGKEHFTLFLRPYTDRENRRHLLKTSASPIGLPPLLVDPIDRPWAQANLGLVFTMLDSDLRRALAEDDVPDAPGIAQTPRAYGEAFQVSTPSPQTTTPEASGVATTTTPTTTTTEPPPVAPAPTARRRVRASDGPPPPPGMKPPARAPGTDVQGDAHGKEPVGTGG